MFWTGLQKNFAPVKTEQNISSVEVFRFVEGSREENVTKDIHCILYSVVSLVVPTTQVGRSSSVEENFQSALNPWTERPQVPLETFQRELQEFIASSI